MGGRAIVGVCSRPFARTSRATLLVEALQGTGTADPSSSSSSSTSSKASFESGNHETPPPPVPSIPSAEEETCSKEPAEEYIIRVPTTLNPASIMRFNEALGVDPEKWMGVKMKMTREGNSKIRASRSFGGVTEGENMPKFGAGSEYGWEAREEAKRRKYGGRNKKKYNADDQPWIMKISGKGNRKYRGVKAGVSENASYYIFAQAEEGILDMVPVNHWYNFTPIPSYKNLTAEQAEEEFERRNKIQNYFSVMVRNRLKDDVDNEEDDEKGPAGKTSKKSSSELKVTEMEDWEDSETNESEEDNEKEEGDKKPKKKCGTVNKRRTGSKDAASKEDSDDGDEEGRELDYISDSTDTESEDEMEKKIAEVGVDQEASTKLLSDSDDEENQGTDLDDEMEKQRPVEKSDRSGNTENVEEKNNSTTKSKSNTENSSKTVTVERLSDDYEEAKTDELKTPTETKCGSSFSGNISDGSPSRTMDLDSTSGSKRKAPSDLIGGITNPPKKSKIELSPSLVQSASSEGITENAIRRYLLRRPMTVIELLRKFKSKRATIPSHDMVRVIAHILDKINPEKRTQNQKLYLYLTDNST